MSLFVSSLSQDDQTALFRKSWTLYDAITERNYMFHRELYAQVLEMLRGYHERREYSMLDLGCGNARFMAPCLLEVPPVMYQGVDLSAVALEEARAHLSEMPGVSFQEADLLEAVVRHAGRFDVIFSGFAVHHLDSAAKQRLFYASAMRLRPGGSLMLVDLVREVGQTREAFLEGYLKMMRTRWTEVLPEQLEEACAHVATYDFPETLVELRNMARVAGLTHMELVGKYGQHHVLRFAMDAD